MSLFSSKKSRNRKIRRKLVHLEDSEGEENAASQDGGKTEGGESEQPANGGPAVTTSTSTAASTKEKVGS